MLTTEEIERIVSGVAGGAANVQDIYPLAPLQEGILFHHLMGGAGDPYLLGSVVSFESRRRLEAYITALQAVIERHDILRTAVVWEGLAEPVQVVWRKAKLMVEEVELDPEAGDVGRQLYERFNPRRYRIDVRKAPLLRIYIAEDKEKGRWLMMQLQHHLAGDHSTLEVMQEEIEAHLLGEADKLAEPLPFRNLVAEARLGVSREEHEAYFRKVLGDVEEPTAPFGLLNVWGDGSGIGEARLRVEAGLARRIRERARRLGVSAASVCHVAWAQVVGRVSGREDVVFGTVLFGRMKGGVGSDRVMGLFINTLPVRIRVGDEGAEASVRRTHEQLSELLGHEHASLALAQRCSGVAAPLPLFSALLNYRHSAGGGQARSEKKMRAWEGMVGVYGEERTNYPFTLSVDDLGEGFGLTAQVEASIGAKRVCEYMHRALESLVAALESEPSTGVCRLEVLPAEERRKVLYEWNDTERDYPADKCVHELFEEQVERTPDAVAVVYGEETLSYEGLNRRANRLAHYLRGKGVKPDARVAICVERGFEMIIGLLGVLKAGGAYVPLDPGYPVERLKYMVEDSGPVALLTQGRFRELFSGIGGEVPVIDVEERGVWEGEPERNPGRGSVGLTPEHLAYVIYTSGSTGIPKGVMVEHASLVNRLVWMQVAYGLDCLDAVFQKTPFGFDVSVWEFFWPLFAGARLVMARPEGQKDPAYLCETIQKNSITTVHFVPSMLQAFLEHASGARCSTLVRVVCSGEALSGTVAQRFQERLPKVSLHNLYGPTETTVDVTEWTCLPMAPASNIPIGKPIANTRIYILDGRGEPVPVGVVGELYIGGAGVARGYLNRAELTAERFLVDRFVSSGEGRMYRTGDLGRWLEDGNIEFVGRNDDQVKIRGYRIEPGEIEARLAEHGGVREAVVVAREDRAGEKRLVAYYTCVQSGEGGGLGAGELRAYLSAKVPEYMVPAAYVRLESLPLTANGKLDRRALPAPEADAYGTREYEAPQTPTEAAVAEIWAEVLKLEQVGRHDNFFELGGHSLLVVRAVERMRRSGLHVDVRSLFATPTVASLASLVSPKERMVEVPANRIPAGCEAITPEMLVLVEMKAEEIERIVSGVAGGAANVQDIYPLAPLQEGILFHHLMGGAGDPYLLGSVVSFESRGRLEAYITALQAVIERHDILRTAVVWEGLAEPVQVVWRKAKLMVEEVELDPEAGDMGRQLYERFNPRRYRIDVRKAPLLRIYIAEDKEKGRWLMMQLLHHLAGDHSTLEVMQEETEAHLLGEADKLAEPLPFRNLVAEARLGVSREEHEAYFRKVLGDVEEPTAPFGLLNVWGDGSGIGEARLRVEAGLARRIRERARRLGVSAASVCHVAWAQVVGRVSGREDVVFGTVLFGRMKGGVGSDRVMGLFINTLPVRIRVGDEGAEASVRRTHEQLSELLGHEHASLALAQRCSGVAAPLPLFSALLNYRHSAGGGQARSEKKMRAWEGMVGVYGEERTNYPFTLSVDDLGEGFGLTAQVEASIGAKRVCEYMHRALESLVAALESEPSTGVCRLEVLPAEERRKVLYEWNDTERDYPADKCVHELFEEQVERTPDAVAVVYGEETLSYEGLNRRANRLAHYLRGKGVKPDARVAICVERGFEMIIGLLGVLKAGGAYVPLDPGYPVERLKYMVEDSGPVALLTQGRFRELFSGIGGEVPVIDVEERGVWEGEPERNPGRGSVGLTPEHLAYVIYTSGSTGVPKGVMVEHAGLLNTLVSTCRDLQLQGEDRTAFVSGQAFDISLWEILTVLTVGGAVEVWKREQVLEVSRKKSLLKRVTVLHAVPGLMREIVEAVREHDEPVAIRLVLTGGDIVAGDLIEGMRQVFERASVRTLYGPTETAILAASFDCRKEAEKWRTAPIGKPIGNTRIYIVDGRGEPVPVGVVGELYIGGAGVARGYLNRAELTAERFLVDRFVSGGEGRMYRTGDLGRWLEDGNIEFVGRNDDQVKIRGYRIEPGEIEARLAEHGGVREAVVVAREDRAGEKRLVAYYTCVQSGEGGGLGAGELRAYLSAKVPEYMVPAAYVRLESLPLTANGKLDRRALPAPEADAYGTREYEAPQTPTEAAVAEIWAEVLKLEQVGRHDNFFELGGHSLLVVRAVERMRRSGLHVDVRSLFATPTVASLASLVSPKERMVEVPANRIPAGCEAITPEMLVLVEMKAEEIERIVSGVAGGAANVQDIYPLAPLQEGILFHHLMGGAGDPYLLGSVVSFESRGRLEAYITALQAVIERHDILRTAVVWEGLAEPVQVVWRKAKLMVEEVELDPEAGDVGRQLYERFNPQRYRIDVRKAPLLRIYIAEDKEKGRWLMMKLLHHLAGDHSTLEVMQEEIEAHLLGEADKLAEPLPFRNLVAEARLGVSREEHEAYFRKVLGDVEEPTAPFGLLNVWGDGSGIGEARLRVEAGLARRIRERARRLGVSAASVCHVAWAQVVGRVSGREDVVFGTVLFGRMKGGVGSDRVMGLFINTLPVRIRVGDEGAEASVRRTHEQLSELLGHEHASLALAQRCSGVAAPLPLFSALLNYRHSAGGGQARSEKKMRAWEGMVGVYGEERTNYPFTLSVDDLGEGFGLTAQVEASIGAKRVCEYMHRALESLVAALESEPSTGVCRLEVLPAEERRKVLYEWNDTERDYPADKCVHELFEEQVERTPDAVAVVYGEETLSYEGLNRRANRLAHYLRGKGVKPDARVAICVERGFEMIIGLLGVLKAGGAYVPLDPGYPVERLKYMVEDSGPVALLTQGRFRELFSGIGGEVPVIDVEERGVWEGEPERNPGRGSVGLTPEHLAYVIYTSGSTGVPKGVMVEHQGLSNYLAWALGEYIPSNAVVSSSFSFDATVTSVYCPLLCGGCVQLLREGEELDGLYAEIQKREGCGLVKITPGHLDALAQRMLSERGSSSVSVFVVGGEALSLSTVELWRQIQPGVRVINEYGPTETVVGCVSYSIPLKISEGVSIPIGKPIGNTRIYIVDGRGEPVPVGVVGELYIGGAGVARGYLNRAELTAERFLVDRFVSGGEGRMYRTGDLGRWLEDGNIEFVGRNDDQVKIRGYRIEPGEIEARLAEHGGVREAVVVAREDRAGEKRLVAYYTCVQSGEGGGLGAGELRAYLSAKVPEYMVPAAYVRLESLPLTANGKLDRRALPAPETDAYGTREYEAPQTPTEAAVAEIWAEVLKLEQVGRHDNFFELGGHSLLAVQVMVRLEQVLNVEVAIDDMFERPVLSDFARGVEGATGSRLPGITRGERGERIRLSFAQQRLWFLAQMEGVSEAYHIPFGVRLQGRLDVAALRQALDRVVERHEALRTTFGYIDGEPVQRIGAVEQSRFQLVEQDLREAEDGWGELDRLMAEEGRAAFDLEGGPVIRGRLIRLREEEQVLLITMHHIVSDGWSMGLLLRELSVLYGAFEKGGADPLPELRVQYADYAMWQRKWIEGGILQEQAEYWKGALAGAPELLELPADHARPAQQDYAGDWVGVELDEKLTAGIRELSWRHGTTLHMTLLGGWAALLGRLSGQEEVVIGTGTANRGRLEIENLIGFFVNTLAVRVDLAGSPQVGELLGRVKGQALGAQQHQDIPFEQVVEIARPARSLAHHPLFQVMFAWQNAPEGMLEMPGLEIRPLRGVGHVMAKFDLSLSLQEAGERIVGGVAYATSLFERATIERYLGYFRRLLEGMVANESAEVNGLAILGEEERRKVLYEWNDTERDYPADKCVHELFEEQVERTPDAVAVVYGEETLSYEGLNRRANRLAHYLRGKGVKPDARVAICVERGFEMIIGLLGVLKAGGAYVPLDPGYPVERLKYMVEDSGPVALLTQGRFRELFSGIGGEVPVIDVEERGAWEGEPERNPGRGSVGLTPEHLAYVIYTSGSTGVPKGVAIEHRNTINLIFWARQSFAHDAFKFTLFSTSLNFDLAVYECFVPISVGATVIILANALELGHTHQPITLVNTVPSSIKALMEADGIPETVRVVNLAGEALKSTIVERLFATTSVHTVCNLYGPSEATTYSTWVSMKQEHLFPRHIGKPIANTRIYILDGRGEPVPVGVVGELYIGGAGVARGYLNRAELTAERFLVDRFVSGGEGRMYRTGDLGRWLEDGNIEFVGRNDDQVKIRGYRIEPGEIEARLAEHGGVREAVVVAREDRAGEKRLVAYYTCVQSGEGGGLGAGELRAYLSAKVPEYMVPAAYVRLESLPLTANGKLDRRALPAPEADAYGTREYEAPQTPTEAAVAEIWAEVLKLEQVGRHDNFFELGGHSLLVVRAVERMRRSGLHVDVRSLFATPTVASLASLVSPKERKVEVPANRIPAGCEAITPEMLVLVEMKTEEIERIVSGVAGGAANVQDIYPLAPLQEGILFHHLMGGAGDPYLLGSVVSFESRGRLEAYITALQAVIERHDILRTAVVWEGLAEPAQVVWRKAKLMVEEVELDPEAGDVGRQLYERFNPRRYRIDVRKAPLLRIYIAEDKEKGRWLMMQLLHHLAGDHSTLEVMQEEIEAHLLGEADKLAEPLPFRNLVAEARLGVSREEHEAYFRKVLGDVEEPTAPFGLLNVWGDGSGIGEARLRVEAGLARRIRERARRLGVSAASVCHVAWAQVVGRVSGREDVVFGTVLFGRMKGGVGSDRVMGLFINTLPVRIRVGDEGAEASVRRTHEQLSELLGHEHASLALAQRCSGVAAPLPLFSALLNYRHSAGGGQARSEKKMRAWEGMVGVYGEERTNYPFTLSVDDLGEGFGLTAQVEASIGAKRVCEYMHRALESLVAALESEPSTGVCRLEVLPAEERRKVLYEWNDTERDYPADKCVHELFEEQVERTPDAVAVVYGEETLSYEGLNRRANRLAHYLRGKGVKPDARVAICVERGFEMIIGLLGVLKAGGAYVPLDPGYPVERLKYMVEDSGPVALLTQGRFRELFSGIGGEVPVIDVEERGVWEGEPERNPGRGSVGLTPEHLAYVIYTSGSTGVPKGVMVEHAGLLNTLVSTCRDLQLQGEDRTAFVSGQAFDISLWEILTVLTVGGAVEVWKREQVLEVSRKKSLLKRVTVLHAVPGLMREIVEAVREHDEPVAIRLVLTGGDIVAGDLIEGMRQVFERASVRTLYGPTETAILAASFDCRKEAEKWRTAPIGKPIGNTRIYIVDGRGEPVPVGVVGELYIGGAGVARGYLNRAELTAERFLVDRFVSGGEGRMYRTGDLGRWLEDGNIEFVGRNDDQVKIRGYRIEPGEIEARLAEHGGVREAVVVVREDRAGEKRLVAYYTCVQSGEGGGLGAGELRAYLSAKVPEYMVPAAYVRLESLPLTANGKLDRRALPAPEADAYGTREYEAPQTPTEAAVAEIWAEVLKLEQVGRHDNFFELGGHSLLAVQVMVRLEQILNVEVAMRDMFERPVLSDFARGVEGATGSRLPGITRGERGERIRLSFAQQRLWFLAQMEGVSEAYHIPFGVRLRGRLDVAALRQALDRVVERHEALRTTFGYIDGEPVQRIGAVEQSRFQLVEQDLREAEDGWGELDRLMAEEGRAAFDLEGGPVIRGRLIRLREEEQVLLITMHHIVSDGWSMGLLLRELSVLYGAFEKGGADPLPELRVQYADYAMWQRKWIEGGILQEQAEYWKGALAGAPELLELPADHARPAQQDYAGDWVGVELDEKLTAGIRELSRRHGTTLHMTLLGGWAALLGRLSGQEEVVIGTPTANRGRLEIENLIGFFVNTLAVRVDLAGSPQVGELLGRVKGQALGAQQHQDIPFEQVVEIARPARSLAHHPLFQVMFAWQNAPEGMLEMPGLEIRPLRGVGHVMAKFDLSLSLREAGERIVGGVAYATSLFERATIERYLGYFRRLLEGMVGGDDESR